MVAIEGDCYSFAPTERTVDMGVTFLGYLRPGQDITDVDEAFESWKAGEPRRYRRAAQLDQLHEIQRQLGLPRTRSDRPVKPSALRAALLRQGVPLHTEDSDGELSVDSDALAEFAADFPVVQAIIEYRAEFAA